MEIPVNSSNEEIDFRNVPPGTFTWVIMVIWTTSCIAVAFFGNVFVLYTSVIHDSIRLDRVSKILIRHIALSNVGFSVYLMSWLGTLITRGNAYPDIACTLINIWGYLFLIAELLLAAALSISKLTLILRPLYTQSRSGRHGHKIAAAAWTFSILWSMAYLVAIHYSGNLEIKFKTTTYLCSTDAGNPTLKLVMRFAQTLIVTGSMTVLVVTTVWLLCFLRKKMKKLQKQAFVTTLLISSTYIISFVPYALVYKALRRFVLPESQVNSENFATFYRTSRYLTIFNCAANPVVYYFTIRSYGNFVRRFFAAVLGFVKCGKFKMRSREQENSLAQCLAAQKSRGLLEKRECSMDFDEL